MMTGSVPGCLTLCLLILVHETEVEGILALLPLKVKTIWYVYM